MLLYKIRIILCYNSTIYVPKLMSLKIVPNLNNQIYNFSIIISTKSNECKRELWVVFNLQSNKIAFEYQSIIF